MAFGEEDDEEDEIVMNEEKKSWLPDKEGAIRLLTAALAFAASILNFATLTKKPSLAGIIVGIAAGLLFVGVAAPAIWKFIKRQYKKWKTKKYVSKEYPVVLERFNQLKQMVGADTHSDTRSFRYILNNTGNYHVEEAWSITRYDYIGGWMSCFEMLLRNRCDSVEEFFLRCGHVFISYVNSIRTMWSGLSSFSKEVPNCRIIALMISNCFERITTNFCVKWSFGQKR
ncbi:MAG TPA: hypothetical protein VKZ53_28820 [Candidatus Angelobacter sp.]|nr:hypothetical protein [Candidatus Angelobacter sp.]